MKTCCQSASSPSRVKHFPGTKHTLSAILWRHENGAKWRAIPAEFGPWSRAAQTFIRWSRLGVWERLLGLAQQRGVALGMVFLDGTSVRAHQKAGGAARKGARRRRGTRARRWAGRGAAMATKACVIADGHVRAIAFRIAPGQVHELPQAVPLLDRLPGVPRWVVGDRGYTSHRFRDHIWRLGARSAIPWLRHEAPVACPSWVYNNRNVVERLRARLKEWRAVATRYERTACSFMGVLCLAAACDWVKV